MSKDALTKAIEICGSQVKLAEKIGVSQQRVWSWLNKKQSGVPAEFVAPIVRAAGGEVTAHDLRPDIFDAPVQAHARVGGGQ